MPRPTKLPRTALATLRAWRDVIARHPLLTAAEECDLATRAQAGDADALERIVCANVRLVLARVPYYLPRGRRNDYGLNAEDLIQEAMLGLRHAVLKFDPGKGCRFSTYAVPWIHQAVTRAIANAAPIRITVHRQRHAPESGDPVPAITESTDALRAPSMEWSGVAHPLRHHDPPDPSPSPEGLAQTAEMRGVIADVIGTLPARMQTIIRARHGFWPDTEPQTLEAIGKRLKLTRERVRQIEVGANARLRDILSR